MQLLGKLSNVALSIERLSDVVDARAEGESSSVDLLPLPPIAGDVSAWALILDLMNQLRWSLKMLVLMFLLVPLWAS